MYRTKQPTPVAAIALVFLAGCSSSSTIPESVRIKAKETKNVYAEALAGNKNKSDPDDKSPPSQHVIKSLENRTMRETASYALGRIGPAAVPGLVQMLRSTDPVMRRQAVETLSRIGPDAAKAVPDLTYALNDLDPVVRKKAALALGQIGPAAADAAPALIRVFQEPGE